MELGAGVQLPGGRRDRRIVGSEERSFVSDPPFPLAPLEKLDSSSSTVDPRRVLLRFSFRYINLAATLLIPRRAGCNFTGNVSGDERRDSKGGD